MTQDVVCIMALCEKIKCIQLSDLRPWFDLHGCFTLFFFMKVNLILPDKCSLKNSPPKAMQMGPETGPQVSEKQDRASDNRNKSSDSSDSLNNDDLEDNNMSSDNYNKENKHKEEEEADKGPAKQKCTLLFSTLQCQHILSNIYKKGITCC